jgi:hypothetical protein
MVDADGENLNSLFDELSEFEEKLKPFADEIISDLAGGAL